MIPVVVILIYLVVIAIIGGMAFRRGKENTEDFFLANRSIGSIVFFLSIFATNMTAFAILGSSGQAYRQGIGIYGLMASSSCFVIPLTLFFIGTRLWAIGKKFGHQTQVSFFRDRWECNHIGTVIFALSAAMLVPYMIISIMGGGTVLANISMDPETHSAIIPYNWGCAVVAIVVTLNVFLGGMRGTVWVNILQTILFLCFGAVAVAVISQKLPKSFADYMQGLAADPKTRALVTREKMPPQAFWSYTLIPLSSIMFPHMAIMCFSARRVSAFKRTVVAYPLAIMAIWLPCVFLGVLGAAALGVIKDPDGVLLRMLQAYAPAWLAGVLGAGIISAVMGSDAHQVLALSTMFTKDVFVHYGGHEKFGERKSVHFARGFIVVVTIIAYLVALDLKEKQGIFEIAIRYAFSGFAAMAPVMVAALFWRRSTKWGALVATLFVGAALIWTAAMQINYHAGDVLWQIGEGKEAIKVFFLNPRGDVSFWNGYMTVVPMVFGSAICMILFSLITPPPSAATVNRYFDFMNVERVPIDAARAQLDAHVCEIMQWHFSPETGCPFWLDWAKKAGWNPRETVQSFADLQRFPHFQDEWLRDMQPEVWVPKKFAGRPFNIFETGGTTGMPKQRIGWDDHKVDYEEFSGKLRDEHFPRGAAWLMVGPTGPRRLRLAIEHLANFRGSSCYFIDLDPRWVKKVLSNKQFDVARAYMDHVVDQAVTILKNRKIAGLFTTPKLLEALGEKNPLYDAGIRGVFCGGTTMAPQYVRFIVEEVLENRIGFYPTYGNTLMGLAASVPLQAEDQFSVTYFAPQPRAVLQVVSPDKTTKPVPYGQWGRVELTTLTREFFMPRFLERDEAIRREARAPYAWDGVAEVRPFGAMEKNIVEGVY